MTKLVWAREIRTKVRGVTHCNDNGESRQDIILGLIAGDSLELAREPQNPVDQNAIAVYANGSQIGYLSRELAEDLAPIMDAGGQFSAEVLEVTGDQTHGVNLLIRYLPADAIDMRHVFEFDAQKAISPLLPLEISLFGYDVLSFSENGQVRVVVSADRGPDPHSQYYDGPLREAGPELIQRFWQFFLTTRAAGYLLPNKCVAEISVLCALWLAVEMTPRGEDGKLKSAVHCIGLDEYGNRCSKRTKHASGFCPKHRSSLALTVWELPITIGTAAADK